MVEHSSAVLASEENATTIISVVNNVLLFTTSCPCSFRDSMPSHFKVKEYCPLVFKNLRDRFGIDDTQYMVSWFYSTVQSTS